ncbi:MAG: hypothetical protein HGB20_07670 [Chlorobiaceae bacterium]|nr:hypothetical protein [Chlorobiaceae bacterium]
MKKQEQLLQAFDKNDLIQKLQDLHLDVPRRNRGRKKIHREKYSVFQFLRVMAQNDRLLYPFALLYSDKPDFVVSALNHNIGIEVVEAVPENKALEQASRIHLPTRRTWGRLYDIEEKKKTIDEIKNELDGENEIVFQKDVDFGAEIIGNEVLGISFLDDEIEMSWINAMESKVRKKRERLNSNDFREPRKI